MNMTMGQTGSTSSLGDLGDPGSNKLEVWSILESLAIVPPGTRNRLVHQDNDSLHSGRWRWRYRARHHANSSLLGSNWPELASSIPLTMQRTILEGILEYGK